MLMQTQKFLHAYSIVDLVKRYPGASRPANDGITLDVLQGEIFGILGDNGAGKSTLVRQMVNLVKPSSGDILLFGRPVAADPIWSTLRVGYMPQDGRSIINMTVGEALYYTAHLRGLSRSDARIECARLLEQWDLGSIADRVGRRISGGQRRLLQLATAMAARPPVVILDEPSNELDPQRRKQMWANVRELSEQHGTTVIFITHDAVEAEKALQRVGILQAGKFVAVGRPADLKAAVFDTLRLELMFDPAQPPMLPDGLQRQEIEAGRWLLMLPRAHIDSLLPQLALNRMVDFKLYSATLEDLYMHYAGQVNA